ncbi:hypothetical protein Tco_0705170 [Tanacetum coccineum]|uniref:Uncharacterized protein n=1 Tax=Tanacetum coccineum TaxID=301880 RepID=A0ABQ4Y3X1_9ASTR
MSSKDAKEESTESDSDNEPTHVPGSTCTKKIEEEAKAEAVRHEGEIRKEELIDLLGPQVVNKYYNDKLQYDRYYDKMPIRRAKLRITNCDILTRKGLITLKVYREDDTSEIIPEFKASDLHLGEWREVVTACSNKKGKGQDFVTIEDFRDFSNTMLYSVQEIFFRLHQGPGLDDHARTFSSLLLVKIEKRNLNPLKQMRVIEQLSVCSGTESEEGLLEIASVQLG